MDCCNNNYHRYHYHQQSASSMMRSSGSFHQYPPHYHHHHHPMGATGGYFSPPPPISSCYGAAAYETHAGGTGMYHHGSDYYSHPNDPSDYSGGGATYTGNAPFHITSPYYHYHHQQPLHINGAATGNGWNSQTGGDYVYNPKEARIRKALRDATREKMLGVGTSLAPNNTQQRPSSGGQRRLAQPWMLPDQDDQIMMSPSEPGGPGGGALRAGMASPMCGTGFPMSIAPMGSYTNPMHHPHAAYINNNPLAQLQQQTDLWNPYHHKSQQTKSPQDSPYLMSSHHSHMSPYAQSHNLPPPPQMAFSPSRSNDNNKAEVLLDDAIELPTVQSSKVATPTITAKMEQPETSPEHHELLINQVVGTVNGQDVVDGNGKIELVEFDGGCNGESSTDLVEMVPTSMGFQQQQQQQEEKIVLQNPFDIPPSVMAINNVTGFHNQQQQQRKKSTNNQQQQQQMIHQQQTTFPSPSSSTSSSCATQYRNTTCYYHHRHHESAKEPPVKPLPDFNEAFGSTERGRYQSPPNNPRMLPILSQSKADCVDFLGFFGNDNMKLEDYHI